MSFDDEFDPIEEPEDDEFPQSLWETIFGRMQEANEELQRMLNDRTMAEAARQVFGPTISYMHSDKAFYYHFMILPIAIPDPATGLAKKQWEAIPLEETWAISFHAAASLEQIPDWDGDCWQYSYKELFGSVQDPKEAKNFPIVEIHFHITWNELMTPRETWEQEAVDTFHAIAEKARKVRGTEEGEDAFEDFLDDLFDDEEANDGSDDTDR